MTVPINHENTPSSPQKRGRFHFLGKLVSPHPSITQPEEQRKVRFLATILLVLATLTSVNLPIRLISGSVYENPGVFIMFTVFCAALFLEYGLCRTPYYKYAPGLAIVTLTAIIYGAFALGGFVSEASLLWLTPILIFASTILTLRDTFLYGLGNILFIVFASFLIPVLVLGNISTALILLFVSTALILVQIQYRETLETIRQQELSEANIELSALTQSLEVRVQARTQDLALGAEVGRVISEIHNLNALLTQAVVLIQERFNLYYTQIYLTDAKDTELILRAGTGEVGRTLLAQQHTLAIDETSINGRAAARREAIIVADTEESDFFRPNEALPETRSEMAIPLIVQNRVVGVIDLQSDEPNALSIENLSAFTTLAGQLAIAIQNADLLSQMEDTTAFLDSIIDNLPLMLFVKEATDLSFVRWNKAGIELTGFAAEELIGKNDYDFFPKEEADFFTEKDRAVLAEGKLVDIAEESIQTAHQGTRLLHTTKVPIRDAYGNYRYLLGISEDITEKRQMEAQLAGRVQQLNLLNDIGRQANEAASVTEFMEWLQRRIPQAMRYQDECVVAIALNDGLFGDARAKELKRHIVEELRLRNETMGRIYVAYTNDDHDFVDEESALMGGIGRRVSSYLENQNLLAQLQLQAADLQKVAEISTAVAPIRNPFELAQTVAEQTQTRFDLYMSGVFIKDESDLVLTGFSGPIGPDMLEQAPRFSLNTHKSLIVKAARTKQPVWVDDVATDPDYMAHPLLPKTGTEIVIPLLVGDELLGVLDFQLEEAGGFTAENYNIFSTLAFQIAISLENANQYEQTQAALEELRSLQNILTGENWESFLKSRHQSVQGYVVKRQSVQPVFLQTPAAKTEATTVSEIGQENAFITPVQIRGTTIGKLGVRSSAESPLSEEDQALLTAVSAQVAEALERARLFEETEIARAQTDQLFAGSERVVRATSLDEVLQALIDSTQLAEMDSVNFLFFDKVWDKKMPEIATVTAAWTKDGKPAATPTGTTFNIAQMPTAFLDRSHPFIVLDILTDQRLDEGIKGFLNSQGIRSIGFFPLVAGGEWIGLVSGQSRQPTSYTPPIIRQITSLVDQAATVAQTQRLFEEANSRAKQELILRQVSERVYSAVDAESVLRTAVTEVGKALGLEAFIYLDESSNGQLETNGSMNKNKAKNGSN